MIQSSGPINEGSMAIAFTYYEYAQTHLVSTRVTGHQLNSAHMRRTLLKVLILSRSRKLLLLGLLDTIFMEEIRFSKK
jgi:hypothetical protein